MRVRRRYGEDRDRICAECELEKVREEGRFSVGALVCDVSSLLDEVLCPADFNPYSLRNRGSKCLCKTSGEGEKVTGKEGTQNNLSQEISGASLQVEKTAKGRHQAFYICFQALSLPYYPFPCL